ncbi:MAG: hypothetical protein NVSMB1_06310 [Polyangiales bacterium]
MALNNAKSSVDGGGIILEILASKFGGEASKSDLDAWIGKGKIFTTSMIDPMGSGTPTLTAFGIRETAVIVDLRTMKIVEKVNGSVAGIGASSVAQLLPKLLALVTK